VGSELYSKVVAIRLWLGSGDKGVLKDVVARLLKKVGMGSREWWITLNKSIRLYSSEL
jgi:hypothetical protein